MASAEPVLSQRTITVLCVDFMATVSGTPADNALYEAYVTCQAWAADVLTRYGGRVQRHARASLLGLFGVDRSREDDAEHALHAAAALHAALPDLLLGPRLHGGVDVSLRVATDTGRAVVAEQAAGGPLVMGEPIDSAATLVHGAKSGDTVLSDRTLRLLRGQVSAELLAPSSPDAFERTAWRLVAVREEGEPERGVRFHTPLVGRAEELGWLVAALDRARDQHAGRLVTFAGPSGIGKSRLLGEFCSLIASSATVLRTRCVDVGLAMTRSPLVDLVEQAAAGPGDSAATLLLSRLHDDPDLTQDAVLDAVLRLVETLAARRPVVVVIEDLQSAEPGLLDFVRRLGRSVSDQPVLVCATARDEPGEGEAAWRGVVGKDDIVWLEPLAESDVSLLVDNLLSGGRGPDTVNRRVIEAADGNPLYAEEFVAMLIDDGLLDRVGDHWVAGDLSRVDVPPTVSSLVAARLDQLPRREARLLQRASVMGRLFYRDALVGLSDDADRGTLDQDLRRLVQRDLIRPEPAAALPGDAFRFRTVLLREISYSSLLAPDRAVMHQRCAEWIEEHGRGKLVDYDELVGYHFEQACRYRAGFGSVDVTALELAERAAATLGAAGRNAFARRDVASAANLLSRAAALLLPEDPKRLALLPDLAATLLERGELRRAERLLDEALVTATAQRHPEIAERAERVLQVVHRFTGSPKRGDGQERVGSAERRLAAGSPSASWSMLSGSADAIGTGGAVADAFDPFAVGLVFDATPVREAMATCRGELAQPGLSLTKEARLKVTLAGLHALDGGFDHSRQLLTEARSAFRELGLRLRTVASCFTAGLVELLAGQPEAAEALLAPASITAEQMGDLYVCSGLLALRARASYEAGSYDAAADLAQRADGMAAADDHVTHSLARGVRGMSLARTGEPGAGVQLVQEALWTVEGSELLEAQGLALRDLAEAMHLAGKQPEARAVFATARGVFERKGDVVTRRGLDGLLTGP